MTKDTMEEKLHTHPASIETVTLQNVEVQANGIIRNSKGRLIARLVDGVDYGGEHIKGLNDSTKDTMEEWEKRFEKTQLITKAGSWLECSDYEGTVIEIKSFIRSELQRQKDELAEKIENLYRGQRKIGEDLSEFQPRVDDVDFGWNDAVSNIISLLKE